MLINKELFNLYWTGSNCILSPVILTHWLPGGWCVPRGDSTDGRGGTGQRNCVWRLWQCSAQHVRAWQFAVTFPCRSSCRLGSERGCQSCGAGQIKVNYYLIAVNFLNLALLFYKCFLIVSFNESTILCCRKLYL